MKKPPSQPQPPTLEEIRARFGQIRGAENQELATKAYVAGQIAPYYVQLLLDCDTDDFTTAEKIEREWFGYGLEIKSLSDIELAQELISGVIRRRHN